MKYGWLVLLTIIIHPGIILAQSTRSMRVKAGDDVAQAYSPNGFYRFPQFGRAVLYYKGGTKNGGNLFNYSIITANLQFIGPRGDTLDLAGQQSLDSVVFENTVFLYNDGFMEVVAKADSLVLLKKTIIKTETENIGAYGTSNNTASVVSMKSYSNAVGVYNLILNQNIVIMENVTWFFAVNNKNPVKATKSNLSKLLPADKQATVESWLKQNKTSFEKEPDLKKLMNALASAN